jgi:hypothetical protein
MLLQLVSPIIQKEDTLLRQSVSPRERLQLTIRFLAIGSFLAFFNYHITRQTVHTQELVIVSHLYSLRPCDRDRDLISVSVVR